MTDWGPGPACPVVRDGRVVGLALRGQAKGGVVMAVLRGPSGDLEAYRRPVTVGCDLATPMPGPSSRIAFEAVMGFLAPGRHPDPLTRTWLSSLAHEHGLDYDALVEAVRPHAEAFASTLPAGVLDLFRDQVRCLPLTLGMWQAVEGFDGNGHTVLARCLRERPLLSRLVVQAHRERPGSFDAAASAIGGLDALLAGQAMRWKGVPRGLLATLADAERTLAGWPGDYLARLRVAVPGIRHDDDIPVRFALSLSHVPPAWHPRGEEGWDAYVETMPALAAALDVATPARDPVAATRTMVAMLDAGRGWPAMRDRVRAAAGGLHLADAVADVDDLTSAFEMQVVTPALALAGLNPAAVHLCHDMVADRAAVAILLSGRGVVGALSLSRAWHLRRPAMEAALAALPGRVARDASWPAGLPDAAFGGLAFTVLTTGVALAMEGRSGPDVDGVEGMGNCVGQYVGTCMRGRSRIVSLASLGPDGRRARVSTAELGFDGEALVIRQHRGPRDGPVPAEARTALYDYVDALVEGRLPMDRAALRPLAEDEGTVNVLDRDVGYDWRVPGNWEAALAAWAPFLRKGVRSMGLAPFAAFAASLADGPLSDPSRSAWLTDPVSPGGSSAPSVDDRSRPSVAA